MDNTKNSTHWMAKLENGEQWRLWFRPSTIYGIPGKHNEITEHKKIRQYGNIKNSQKMISLLLQGPLIALLMQQTWSSSQEEEIIRHTR